MAFLDKKDKAFTLTEILLAVAIVGIIAALVIPAMVSKFDTTILEHGFTRQMESIQTAIDLLPITENKADFGDTSMFSSGTKTMDESAGKFIKRYLRVSKYYGDAAANKDLIKKECFAPAYYEYSNNEKKEFTIDSKLVGACAKLKNGASLCLAPQVGAATNIQGVMDINGPKGPNIYGRDLRDISLGTISFTNRESIVSAASSTAVNTIENPGLAGDGGYSGLCEGEYTADCCNYHFAQGRITSSTHQCCDNPAVSSSYPACAKDITLRLNLYPSSCNNSDSSCRVYINPVNTTAKLNNSTTLSTLPASPPPVYLYCDGKKVGSMSSAQLKNALESTSSGTESYVYFNKTSSQSATCGYQTGQGIKSTKSSVVFSATANEYHKYNGINWTLTYY